MSATLKVTQEAFTNPAGIMRGTFDVVVDGKSVRSIKSHEAIRGASRTWTSHPASPQRPILGPEFKAFDAAEGQIRRLPMQQKEAPADLGQRRSSRPAWPSRSLASNQRGEAQAQAVPGRLAGHTARRDDAWTSAASGVVTPPAGLALALPAFCPKAGLHQETAGPASGRTGCGRPGIRSSANPDQPQDQ